MVEYYPGMIIGKLQAKLQSVMGSRSMNWKPGQILGLGQGQEAPPPTSYTIPSPYNPLGVYPANGHTELAGQGHHKQTTGMWAEWFYNNRLP